MLGLYPSGSGEDATLAKVVEAVCKFCQYQASFVLDKVGHTTRVGDLVRLSTFVNVGQCA